MVALRGEERRGEGGGAREEEAAALGRGVAMRRESRGREGLILTERPIEGATRKCIAAIGLKSLNRGRGGMRGRRFVPHNEFHIS